MVSPRLNVTLDAGPSRARWLLVAGDTLAAWALALAVENVAVALAYKPLIAGAWELQLARVCVSPIALAALAPAALLAAPVASLVARAAHERASRAALALGAFALGALEGYGVTFGRHFASLAARAPFVLALGASAAVGAWALAPRAARLARARPALTASLGAAGCALAWLADATVLPRLYPAFHLALFALVLACAALVPRAWRASTARAGVAWGALSLALVCAAWAPRAAARLKSADNLRLVLVEHAPILGRAVRLAARLAPPDDASDGAGAPDAADRATGASTLGPPRALDWTGRDLLVVSVDALRADHVGAYGYARPTTPNLDQLAREGALFEAAYCPTPHTSYSVTSMMTGKYMRPLLALGAGSDSETWAGYARRYGYRTAAFYPPAVFFIDQESFRSFEARGLDFEYRKVEFAPPELRAEQVAAYLATAPKETPLFLWVHLFEPHEPYVMHPEHPFGPADGFTDVDAYDSEIAAADAGLGAIVREVRAARPGAVVVVTADHGEEFGEHGGRYHGTTVYEEQVRVPLVVVAPGVPPARVRQPVQTIDLLPTALSALGVPRPPRLRGRDLGPVLAGKSAPGDAGNAFAETDEYTLLARGDARLVCARKASACALYDVAKDPGEAHDVTRERAADAREMRTATRAIERENGRFEAGQGAELPEALRRGLQGDADAAEDVAALLDDASVTVRRRAAAVLFELAAPAVNAPLRRALARDEDDEVRRWSALALVRVGDAPGPLAASLATDPDVAWRRRAALAFADRGDARGEAELVAWWADEPARRALPFEHARALLAALARIRAKNAAPVVVRSLSDVRLRPAIADALGALGDARAKPALLDAFARERYVSARPHEARALVALGARAELAAPLARFAGLPEPMPEALLVARDAKLLEPDRGGWTAPSPVPAADATVRAPSAAGPLRVLVQSVREGTSPPRGTLDGAPLAFLGHGALHSAEISAAPGGRTLALHLEDQAGLVAAWVVPRSEELPPPPPEKWDAGADGAAPP